MPPRVKLKHSTAQLNPESSPILLYTILALLLRLILILWSFHQDKSPLKYTDIDYTVFTSAARCLLHPNSTDSAYASGPMSPFLPSIGDPYARDTYRYTPLVAILSIPNILIHHASGKLLFSLSDLLVGYLLYRLLTLPSRPRATPRSAAHIVASIWLLNPIIANISTRGSSESVLGLIVVSTLFAAESGQWDKAAIGFGVAVHFKVFPVIYGSSLIAAIARLGEGGNRRGWRGTGITKRHVRFGVISLLTFMSLNGIMYSIWGQPFLLHTFLYHIHRLDHRHNFSPYFYPYYLSEFLPSLPSSPLSLISVLQHPLGAFVPQLGLATILGFAFGGDDLAFALFVQTFAFVSFNKVCTSQYFLWYLWLLPPILARLRFTFTRSVTLISIWVLSQALWLSQAYRLEMKAESVFLQVWATGWIFLGVNCWILGEVVGAYTGSGETVEEKKRGSQ